MGLDMYAWRVPADEVVDDFTIPLDADEHRIGEEFFYWRKHHDLHGWMEQLYRKKGGDKEHFNCVGLRLTSEDLAELQKVIDERTLPQTQGFFFGNNPPDDESDSNDLDFIDKAQEIINEGDAVYYYSWW